jgi:hypothetical protein
VTKFIKVSVVALFTLAVACFFGEMYLSYDYGVTKPRFPDPANGRVIKHNDHPAGTVVYLTKPENDLLFWLEAFSIGLAAIGLLINVRLKVFPASLEGLTPHQQFQILHGPRVDYKAVRETYKAKDDHEA